MSFELKALKDICTIQIGKTPSRHESDYWRDGTHAWLSIADMNQGRYLNNTKEYITDLGVKASNIKLIPKNTLVLSYKLSIGKVGITQKPMYTNEAIASLTELDSQVDINYLYWALQHIDLLENADRAAMGKTLNKAKLSEVKIPLPPLEEQRRIASILDQADVLRQKRQQAIEKLDQLLQATFIDMFGDPVSNPKGWDLGRLGDLGTLDRGISKHRPRGAPELLGGIHPLIQTGDVARSQGYIRTFTSTYSDLGLAQSKKWAKGTLCITIAANIANTGILTFEACFPDSVVGFTANQTSNVEFVQGLFLFFKQILEEKAPQSAQKNINLAILRDLEIPIPPQDLQEKWSKIALNIEDQKQKLYKQLDIQNQLFSSLQNQAFSGTL